MCERRAGRTVIVIPRNSIVRFDQEDIDTVFFSSIYQSQVILGYSLFVQLQQVYR